ncbi:MAG: VWA domain-containing protein [Chloroflexi bacterium]|nr:VWA domain-containing protein [Chloroflexota bacterium]MBM3154082.1 VWA domain-containing protein [Chloroflexota bacterium]MBM3172537.1 VWA domain-containing protein [Chloroflexota bacterium]MBM3175060.1 VWA domain-containing protein [Chloroflexota bacterium]MBM4450913.1 VWA domain-containing protein [Chloroflexota bacterium]
MTVQNEGVEITKRTAGEHVLTSHEGVEIHYRGKPITDGLTQAGYVYLVIDCSGSMEGNKIKQAKKGALNFAKEALAKGYSTGLIQFHSFPTHLCEPQKDISKLEVCLSKLVTGDLTYMADAIHLAIQQLKNRKGTRIIVVVTDGMPNGDGDPQATLKAGQDAKNNGVDIIVIGTDDADKGFLGKLASRAGMGLKVVSSQFEKAITDSAKMLPQGSRTVDTG